MAKRVLELPQALERKAWASITSGFYESFDHLVAVAIENQLRADAGDATGWFPETPAGPGLGASPKSDEQLPNAGTRAKVQDPMNYGARPGDFQALASLKPNLVPDPKDSNLVGALLWGQFYRFLPSKPALRVLAAISVDGLPNLALFKQYAGLEAERVGAVLRGLDNLEGKKYGDQYSTSFPDENDKSRVRYRDQYLAYVRPTDNRLDGMLPRLKFINIVKDGGTYKVGLTSAGWSFAKIRNPVMDDKKPSRSPLSSEEAGFLIAHISEKLPAEAAHLSRMLTLLDEGVSKREELNLRMAEYYVNFQEPGSHWTEGVISTMRAGLVSRLYELGAVAKSRTGLEVRYELTKFGSDQLKFLKAKVRV